MAAMVAMDMMDDEQSITLFVVITSLAAVLAAVVLPTVLPRLSLRRGLLALSMVGPLLAIVGSLVGTGAMSLSGHDVKYVLIVAGLTGLVSMVVGWRLAQPLASNLETVADTVAAIAGGERGARTGIERSDEVGDLAAAVDELGRSLVRAESERAAAEDERTAVVSALSHDLRTPLASLLASVDALDDGVADASTHLRAMRGNVRALERLVEDLFLLARADSGQLMLQAEPLDLAELIDEAVDAVAPAAAERGVSLTVARSGDAGGAVHLEGDDHALGRVLRNLLDNAIRHTPVGGAVRVEVAGGDTTRVSVTDDGPGFDADFVPRAFERFTQADDARSGHGGAGLGLAIAKTLVEAHHGTVTIAPGPGGTIHVDLPRRP